MATESLYEHAGGDEGLHRLEVLFYDKALADPVLRTLFTERVPTHVDHLTWFTAESFGGPDRFTRELGFRYGIAVSQNTPDAVALSEEVERRYGKRALVSMAYAVACSRVYPALKRGLGHGVACAKINVSDETIVLRQAA